jgi:micrococcal nuclease
LTRALAIVCLLLVLAACGRNPLDRLARGEAGRVAEVRSGDTLVLQSGLVVRLAGVDAPNSRQPYAREATAELERLATGQDVQLFYGGSRRDRYDRALAQVRLEKGGVWLQERLLESGAAWVRTYSDNRALAAEMLAAEAKGRQDGKGVWALTPPLVRLPIEAVGRRGFHIVEGRVSAAAPDALVLDGLMRAEVPAPRRADFTALALDQLRGRLVRVRGPVGRDNVLRLDHPEQIELLEAR